MSVQSGAARLIGRLPPGARRIAIELIREVRDDRLTGLAGEVAFFGILSLFPWLLAMAAAVASLDTLIGSGFAAEAEALVVDSLNGIFSKRAAAVVEAIDSMFDEDGGGLFTLGVLLALWSSSRGFAAVISALNLAYDVEERRSAFRRRLLAIAFALGSIVAGVLVLAAFVAGPLLGGGRALADLFGLGGVFAFLWDWLRWPAGFVVLVLWVAVLYRFAPVVQPPWRMTLPGAVSASLLWLLASAGFATYLRVVADANLVFGTLGGGLTMLVWFYLLSFSLLLGGELNAVLENQSRGEP